MRGAMRNAMSRFWFCCAIAAIAATALSVTQANAVSLRVKLACSSDYRALCSQYASDSPEVRACMRAAGERLSSRCLNALIAAGEVSQEEVSRRAAQAHQ